MLPYVLKIAVIALQMSFSEGAFKEPFHLYVMNAECLEELKDDGPQWSCEVLCEAYPDEQTCNEIEENSK